MVLPPPPMELKGEGDDSLKWCKCARMCITERWITHSRKSWFIPVIWRLTSHTHFFRLRFVLFYLSLCPNLHRSCAQVVRMDAVKRSHSAQWAGSHRTISVTSQKQLNTPPQKIQPVHFFSAYCLHTASIAAKIGTNVKQHARCCSTVSL